MIQILTLARNVQMPYVMLKYRTQQRIPLHNKHEDYLVMLSMLPKIRHLRFATQRSMHHSIQKFHEPESIDHTNSRIVELFQFTICFMFFFFLKLKTTLKKSMGTLFVSQNSQGLYVSKHTSKHQIWNVIGQGFAMGHTICTHHFCAKFHGFVCRIGGRIS